MSFPKHHIITDDDIALQNLQGKEMRRIDFAPMFFCEFFQGMEIIQMQGKASKEYIFGIYWSGRLVGHCYFEDTYTLEEIAQRVKAYMPPSLNQLKKFVKKYSDDIWYHKFDVSQYAWIYDRVVTRVKENTSR